MTPGLISLSPFDSSFSPPGHFYVFPPCSLLYITLNLYGSSRLWIALKDLITGLIAVSPFDSPFSPPSYLYLPPSLFFSL